MHFFNHQNFESMLRVPKKIDTTTNGCNCWLPNMLSQVEKGAVWHWYISSRAGLCKQLVLIRPQDVVNLVELLLTNPRNYAIPISILALIVLVLHVLLALSIWNLAVLVSGLWRTLYIRVAVLCLLWAYALNLYCVCS